jgi:ribonucleoside-diphosphate reductase alpha chain
VHPEGGVGEIFITMAKAGSTLAGLVNCFAQVVSVALQYGVPLDVLCEKFIDTRFEPAGFTGNPEIPVAHSIIDYIFRWLRLRFVDKSLSLPAPAVVIQSALAKTTPTTAQLSSAPVEINDGPPCKSCGSLTRRNGSCFACTNCGSTTGCG